MLNRKHRNWKSSNYYTMALLSFTNLRTTQSVITWNLYTTQTAFNPSVIQSLIYSTPQTSFRDVFLPWNDITSNINLKTFYCGCSNTCHAMKCYSTPSSLPETHTSVLFGDKTNTRPWIYGETRDGWGSQLVDFTFPVSCVCVCSCVLCTCLSVCAYVRVRPCVFVDSL